ncbi:c-type cytochrome [Hydrogenimonas urashimensis]|uniref:c-type cytochrome n=1 Tax=Hydrogenimonas urashimensis TaxID=2740515 RepID=UPI0019161B7D|nr:c-type cytochrome [Hydrogenimonas urashimensis]
MFCFISLDASVFKGQRAYMKLCKSCHKSGGKLAKSHTQEEWEEYFDNNAKLLKSAHAKDSKVMDMLNSEKFNKNLKHMKQFFYKYASDSGNVPACN